MRRALKLFFVFIIILILLPALKPAGAQETAAAANEPAAGSVVCPPGIYDSAPGDCLPLGPSQSIQDLVASGIPYPIRPLPAYNPDQALANIPFDYVKLTDDTQALYFFSSLEDAEAASTSSQKYGPGEVYVSYDTQVKNDNGVFYRLRSGYWVRGDWGSVMGRYQQVQGLVFTSTPRNGFGWILGTVESMTQPGFNAPKTGKTYYRYNLVQVYGSQEAEGNTWYMIGPDEWVDYRQIGRVTPRSAPPEGVPSNRWIEVNLDEQTLAVYQDNRLLFATLISSGIENLWTRPGIFQIYEKLDSEDMSGSTAADGSDYYHVEDVPWTMYFDEKRALHGAYWHSRFGYPNSHGCVNISLVDSHWLYDWAVLGDYVYVYDPSGHTPTDPALFGSGAP